MEKQISLNEAIQWITKMAAKDGVISQNERRLLKEFSIEYNLDANKLYRIAYAMAKESQQEVELASTNEIKGLRFEEFVVSLIADKSRFKLLAWRSDKIIGNTYAAENLYPDLHIRHKTPAGEVEYFIECKYRSSWDKDGNVDLSNQFLRYRNFAKEHNCELFFAIGVGGTPSDPDKFIIIPSRMIDLSKKINQNRFTTCICDKTSESFNSYICNYFNKRVFSTQ